MSSREIELQEIFMDLSQKMQKEIESIKAVEDNAKIYWDKTSKLIGIADNFEKLKPVTPVIELNYKILRTSLQDAKNRAIDVFSIYEEILDKYPEYKDQVRPIIDSLHLINNNVGNKLESFRNSLLELFYEKEEIIDKFQIGSKSETKFKKSVEQLYTKIQAKSELQWREKIQHVYIYTHSNGLIVYEHSFKDVREIEANLVSGGLTGLSMLIQEITKEETLVKIIEQEGIMILLEHGKYLTAAIIAEENLITIKNKLKILIQDLEEFFQEELERRSAQTSLFRKMGKFIEKIFN